MESPLPSPSQFLRKTSSSNGVSVDSSVIPRSREILNLMNELERIERERRAIQDLVDAHYASLAPTVPDDVLSEIFMHCLPETYNATRSLSEAPLLLGQVCRRWREVSLSTPRLWTSLHIVIPTDADPDVLCSILESRRKGVEAWLGRSGVLPLSISIYSKFSSGCRRHPETIACIRRLMDSFTRLSSRWRDVELRLSNECFGIFRDSMGSAWGEDGLPFLNLIKLNVVDRVQVVISEDLKKKELEFISKLGEAACLTSISLISTAYCSHDLRLPLGNLSKLDLSPAGQLHLTNDEALQLLSQCTNIRYCRLPKVLMLTRPTSTVELPHLENLHARIKSSSDYLPEPVTSNSPNDLRFHTILDCISAPALKGLTVEFESYSTSQPLSQVPFISLLRPGHRIEQLDMTMNLSSGGMLECLELAPKLKVLRFACSSKDKDTCTSVVSALIPSTGKSLLCPGLSEIYIPKDRKVSDELLLKLARTRRDPKITAMGVTPLEVLHAKLDRHRQIVDLDKQITELRRDKLDLVLTHLPDGEDLSWCGQEGREPSGRSGEHLFWL
ncbi:hypothetical protein K435DRAFT_82603 [Dendrothele bispora CBS 962.96]|uniref:F-box domain-containing protein n=1 Tax=Dendrothele bispora (strain CBS 962.96) TaxID=1314807 RepID=A0A4S8M3Z6_DENBC|nr:hypothetical protein K435DRAFT_82603 [Dendrothele bispora CBS 962.96]